MQINMQLLLSLAHPAPPFLELMEVSITLQILPMQLPPIQLLAEIIISMSPSSIPQLSTQHLEVVIIWLGPRIMAPKDLQRMG